MEQDPETTRHPSHLSLLSLPTLTVPMPVPPYPAASASAKAHSRSRTLLAARHTSLNCSGGGHAFSYPGSYIVAFFQLAIG